MLHAHRARRKKSVDTSPTSVATGGSATCLIDTPYILGVHQLQDYVFLNIYHHQKAFVHCSGLFRVHDSQE